MIAHLIGTRQYGKFKLVCFACGYRGNVFDTDITCCPKCKAGIIGRQKIIELNKFRGN